MPCPASADGSCVQHIPFVVERVLDVEEDHAILVAKHRVERLGGLGVAVAGNLKIAMTVRVAVSVAMAAPVPMSMPTPVVDCQC